MPPIEVSSKEGCACKKIWSIEEGLVVDVPLKEEKIVPSDLGRRSSCPSERTSIDVAQSSSMLMGIYHQRPTYDDILNVLRVLEVR